MIRRMPRTLHRPLSAGDDLDEVLAWREDRTVTQNLTLHYDRMMLMLDPTPRARGLVRKKVEIVNYPDGRFAVQFDGTALGFRVNDNLRTVRSRHHRRSKRLSAVLEQVKDAAGRVCRQNQQRRHVARQRLPNSREAPGLPSSKGRALRGIGRLWRRSEFVEATSRLVARRFILLGEGDALKGCASRTGKCRLRPLTPSPSPSDWQ